MNDLQKRLLASAQKAAERAYADYSQFHVGAAVLAGGKVFAGANIENASANLGLCAERVAIAHARMRSKASIEGLAVFCADAARGSNGVAAINETLPCGACRQWIAELAPDAWIVTNGSAKVYSIDDFLPQPFALTKRPPGT
jgi:cytidine deaminase